MTKGTRLAAGIVETTDLVDKRQRAEDVNGAESGRTLVDELRDGTEARQNFADPIAESSRFGILMSVGSRGLWNDLRVAVQNSTLTFLTFRAIHKYRK
ncbi:MAG: hypothetical protein GY826_27505 [Fuerstiella sp.]|nr:hypothetical protein [Fuerstiella sp.]